MFLGCQPTLRYLVLPVNTAYCRFALHVNTLLSRVYRVSSHGYASTFLPARLPPVLFSHRINLIIMT